MFFFPLHGRREKNQEGMRIFIILSHADPAVLMCTREKIQKKAFSCKERAVSGVHAAGAVREKRARVSHGARGGCRLHPEYPAAWTPRPPLSLGRKTSSAGRGGYRVPPAGVPCLQALLFFQQRISKDRAAHSLTFYNF